MKSRIRGQGDLSDKGHGHLYVTCPWIDGVNVARAIRQRILDYCRLSLRGSDCRAHQFYLDLVSPEDRIESVQEPALRACTRLGQSQRPSVQAKAEAGTSW